MTNLFYLLHTSKIKNQYINDNNDNNDINISSDITQINDIKRFEGADDNN